MLSLFAVVRRNRIPFIVLFFAFLAWVGGWFLTNCAGPSAVVDFEPRVEEARLQEKAERLLRGLGEHEPVVVVTASWETGRKVTTSYRPLADGKVLESTQTTHEEMDRKNEENGRYVNTKEAHEFSYAATKTFECQEEPRVVRVCCLVEVGSRHASRVAEIEQALGVALGLDGERGDRVMVMVR